jgi:NitT/TauT family transport system substrate-binding protein/putative hydroxymethylpyrimidine transport system substrate-binding protein
MQATLVLDFTPNAVHAGIYRALAAGYYQAANISLRIVQPTSTADTLRLIDAGKADFGLADGSDVAQQIDMGRDATAVLAITQRPLGGLITLASEHFHSPADLQGKTVGITGVPSDRAVLDTEVRYAGGNPARVRVVTIGFNGASDLEAGKIAAFTGFWPADGVQVATSGHPINAFKLDEYGGPPYPGLVAFTTQHERRTYPALVRAFVAATIRGYEDTLRDPTQSLDDLLAADPALQPTLTQASLQAYLPLFTDNGTIPFGQLRLTAIDALSKWMLANHLIRRPVAPSVYAAS